MSSRVGTFLYPFSLTSIGEVSSLTLITLLYAVICVFTKLFAEIYWWKGGKRLMLRKCYLLQVAYVPEGLEAIIFTADGDMRQGLNNLQATHSGFGFVNQENVFKVIRLTSLLYNNSIFWQIPPWWFHSLLLNARFVTNLILCMWRIWCGMSLKENLMMHVPV